MPAPTITIVELKTPETPFGFFGRYLLFKLSLTIIFGAVLILFAPMYTYFLIAQTTAGTEVIDQLVQRVDIATENSIFRIFGNPYIQTILFLNLLPWLLFWLIMGIVQFYMMEMPSKNIVALIVSNIGRYIFVTSVFTLCMVLVTLITNPRLIQNSVNDAAAYQELFMAISRIMQVSLLITYTLTVIMDGFRETLWVPAYETPLLRSIGQKAHEIWEKETPLETQKIVETEEFYELPEEIGENAETTETEALSPGSTDLPQDITSSPVPGNLSK